MTVGTPSPVAEISAILRVMPPFERDCGWFASVLLVIEATGNVNPADLSTLARQITLSNICAFDTRLGATLAIGVIGEGGTADNVSQDA